MGPVNAPLTIQQNTTFRVDFLINNADGTPADLTGVTAAMSIKSNYASAEDVLTLSSPSNGIVVAPTGQSNYVTVSMSPSQTMGLAVDESQISTVTGQPYTNYVYDLLITMPSGDIFKQAYGVITVYGTVTA
jgi:hypothetical protein